MDARIRHLDEVPGLPVGDLIRVRGVTGVDWAVPFHKGRALAKLSNGESHSLVLMGLDDSSFVGAPVAMLAGNLADLHSPDAVIIDKAGYEYMWPIEAKLIAREGYRLGKTFEMHDRRAVLVRGMQGFIAVRDHAVGLHAIQPGGAGRTTPIACLCIHATCR